MTNSLNSRRFKYAHKLAASWASYKGRRKHKNFCASNPAMALRYQDFFSLALKVAYTKVNADSDAKRNEATVDFGRYTVARETPKATCYEVYVECYSTGSTRKRSMWMPKSMMQGQVAPAWFANKKFNELLSEFDSYGGQVGIAY